MVKIPIQLYYSFQSKCTEVSQETKKSWSDQYFIEMNSKILSQKELLNKLGQHVKRILTTVLSL
jgi:hypothetical protein